MGGRSRVAAQLLSGRGFKEVYNLRGGIRAWEGERVTGPPEVGMNLITGRESPSEMLLIAYAMEEGLRSFYRRMGASVSDREAAELFERLAAMDTHHKGQIFALYEKHVRRAVSVEELEERILPDVMEGGMTTEELLASNRTCLETVGDVLTLAMMLEGQAFDLYLRYSRTCEDLETKVVLQRLADEEKAHLTLLGSLRERY